MSAFVYNRGKVVIFYPSATLLRIEPEREAKLVILLLDYFKQDRDTDPEFVQKLLESAT